MGIEITGQVQWQAWQDRVLPPVERVAPGLWSVPVPIPDNPLRYVLVYALEADDGLVLVDAGWDDDASWAALTRGIAEIGADVGDVRGVLVTHFHGDHLGLAGRVREASGAWIALHELDAAEVKNLPAGIDEWIRVVGGHLQEHGVAADEAHSTVEAMEVARFLTPALADRVLADGDVVRAGGRELRAVWTPGHTPGHTCFYEPAARLLFSGDHVLPRITPQIAVFHQDGGDPLAEYLRSLGTLDGLDVDEVLPAHEYRFRGLRHRTAVMVRHHVERLAELLALVERAPGTTAWELAALLSWSRPWESFSQVNRRFALSETLAHLVTLESRGEAHCSRGVPVRWYGGGAPQR
ncbi:MBL fold metallo-hydrolase [Streptomyces sp. NPDC017979]|uniref:MBL fold metallo-hydrolase n=1 Tax=Streptomyces sp. NPDC017979 TaxID=3365024 RepID=UPI00379AA834